MLLDPRNGPGFDHPWEPGARTYVIASTPRTGSTLLARSLWNLGLGAPKEYVNPMQLRDWEVRLGTPLSRWFHQRLTGRAVGLSGRGRWPRARRTKHLERVRRRRTHAGWFGLKLHRHHCERFFGADSPEDLLGPITWIRIIRQDRVAQAASWAHALQSGRWSSSQPTADRVPYNRARIERRLRRIEADEATWDGFFEQRTCTTITYEELIEGEGQHVLDSLGHPGPLPPPPLRPQADAEDWVERYRSGYRRTRKVDGKTTTSS